MCFRITFYILQRTISVPERALTIHLICSGHLLSGTPSGLKQNQKKIKQNLNWPSSAVVDRSRKYCRSASVQIVKCDRNSLNCCTNVKHSVYI